MCSTIMHSYKLVPIYAVHSHIDNLNCLVTCFFDCTNYFTDYASKVASLVTAKYEALLAEVEAFKPSLSACAQSVNDTVNKCVACLDTVDCAPR